MPVSRDLRIWSSPSQSISVHIEFSAWTGGNQSVATGKTFNDFNVEAGRAYPGHPDHKPGPCPNIGVAGTSPAMTTGWGRVARPPYFECRPMKSSTARLKMSGRSQ
jgi:hypothetical protein